jgi:DNA polymerase
MTVNEPNATRALIQYLETDRQFGLRDVPVARLQNHTATATEATRNNEAALQALDEQHVKVCTKCALADTRINTVFGQGNPNARLVFVGEAPGAEEDRQGTAFVGRAGQLLTRMIQAMGLTREDVFICNVLKCRPPDNRDPAPDEIVACSPYLMEQLMIIQPEVIVALGAPAARTLLQTNQSIGRLRGRFHDYYPSGSPLIGNAVPLMPTYHPAYLLRSPAEKGKAWQDLQAVMAKLGIPNPRSS